MFFRILKKDLKRKKTMNIILLLFVVMSAMFAGAAVNNLSAVTKGIDRFLDLADAPELMLSTAAETADELENTLGGIDSVKEIKTEENFFLMSDSFRLDGEPMKFVSAACIYSDIAVKYFDSADNEITEVPKGSFYCTANVLDGIEAPEKGALMELEAGGKKFTFRYESTLKDAAHVSNNQGSPRIMLNKADFDEIEPLAVSGLPKYKYFYVKTDDPDAVRDAISDMTGVNVTTRAEMSDNFLYDKLTAYIMLAICVVLLITAFVVLRFTIGFTITEEFREIGVMKAVGIDNGSIRGLYIVKYAAIAVVGSATGFFCSIPLSGVLLDSVSKNIVFGGGGNMLLALAGSAAVVVMILLFCYGCTRRVKKLSPIDAVRNGQTGERFGKKSLMHLGRSRLPATGFLAVNDIASAPRQFIIITIIFTLCVLMMTIMSNSANTLSSDKPIELFCISPQTDITIMDNIDGMNEAFTEGADYESLISKTEKTLAENGIPGKATVTYGLDYTTTCGDNSFDIQYIVTKNTSAENFTYLSGSAPVKEDECAMTDRALEKLGAEIGDRVKADVGGAEKEFIITGTFSSFMNGGYTARLCENAPITHDQLSNFLGLQFEFDGQPDRAELRRNADKVKEIFDIEKVLTNAELVDYFTSMSGTMNGIKKVMMVMTVIVTSLIVILMERSFISKEKTEIALMKAVGLRSRSIVGQHVMRFGIAALTAAGIASAAVLPISKWLINFIFSMIGSVRGVNVAFDAFEIFFTCPAILISVTIAGSFLTALYMKTITATDAASIE